MAWDKLYAEFPKGWPEGYIRLRSYADPGFMVIVKETPLPMDEAPRLIRPRPATRAEANEDGGQRSRPEQEG